MMGAPVPPSRIDLNFIIPGGICWYVGTVFHFVGLDGVRRVRNAGISESRCIEPCVILGTLNGHGHEQGDYDN